MFEDSIATRISLIFHRLVSLEYAIAQSDGLGRAAEHVEQCDCPRGYQGLSCQVGVLVHTFGKLAIAMSISKYMR